MNGKAGTAPCGHPGEHVVGNYIKCLSGCDRVPLKGAPKCSVCGEALKTQPANDAYGNPSSHKHAGETYCAKCHVWVLKDGSRLRYQVS